MKNPYIPASSAIPMIKCGTKCETIKASASATTRAENIFKKYQNGSFCSSKTD